MLILNYLMLIKYPFHVFLKNLPQLLTSFNRLQRGIANCIGRHTNQPQNPVDMEVDAEQLSPTSLHTQLAAYQSTVRDLHDQN